MEPRWLTRARKYIGQKEVPGVGNNPVILTWWQRIKSAFTQDAVPWCAAFVGGVLEEVGIKSSRSAMARSYQWWGTKLYGPAVGAIVVFAREGGGHVGFVTGVDGDGNPIVLGGNQGDMVSIRAFSKYRVLSYRWPKGEQPPTRAQASAQSVFPFSNNEA